MNSSQMLNQSMSSNQIVGHGQLGGIGTQAHAELEQMLMASGRSSMHRMQTLPQNGNNF